MLALLTSLNLRDNPNDYAKVEIEVLAPPESGDCIYMSGAIRELGSFEAKGLKLIRIEPGRYKGSFYTAYRGEMEYKYNLGTWNNVEKSRSGEDLAGNRIVALDGSPLIIRDRVASWAGLQKSTITGDFQIFFDFKSRHLKQKRNIYVWLPPGYNSSSKKTKYPLVLCNDGQNLFDASLSYIGVEWEMDETATSLIQRYEIEPVIIVGVANTDDRTFEYTPFGQDQGGGGAAAYGRFIVEELMPFLIKRLKVDTRSGKTCTLGSSLGAVAAMYLFLRYPRIFQMAAVMSPVTPFVKGGLQTWTSEQDVTGRGKLWLDVGTEEGIRLKSGVTDAVREVRQIRDILVKSGFIEGKNLGYCEDPGGGHNELSWQRRVSQVLRFLYGQSFTNLNPGA